MRKVTSPLAALFLALGVLCAERIRAEESAVQLVEMDFVPAPPGAGDQMFTAIATGPDGKIYQASANGPGITAHLFVYDPQTKQVTDLADIQKLVGENDPQLARHTKIHTQLVFDKRGVLWFATASAEREEEPGKFTKGYTGGHLVSYDPRTGQFTDHGVLLPQLTRNPSDFWEMGEAIITLTIDPDQDRLYMLTYPNAYFVVYDIPSGKHKVVGRASHWPPIELHRTTPRDLKVAADGRVYTFSAEGQVIRYDPKEDKTPWLAPGEDYRKILEKPGTHNPTGLQWLPVFVSGSDGVKTNHVFAFAMDTTRTRIYGFGDGGGFGNCFYGKANLFELIVEPGKEPVLNDLGSPLPKGAERWYALNIAIALADDTYLYYHACDDKQKVHLMRFDIKARTLDDLGVMALPGYERNSPVIRSHGATVGRDGSIYFGGRVPNDDGVLGFSIYKPE